MSSKHTPGPWAVSKDEFGNVIVQQGRSEVDKDFRAQVIWTIATMTNGRPGKNEAEANAALTAQAPDPLASLKRMVALFEQQQRDAKEWEGYQEALALIRKAEGR